MDFSKTKFRASSWGNLLTEPVSKADKESGKLSATCQKELIKIYNRVVYGRVKDITTKQMDKGIQCEEDSIKLLCKVDGVLYYKNDDYLENEWFCGHPDIFIGDNIQNSSEVWDIKTSWDLDSFMPKLIEPLDKGYEAQLNAYYSLTGVQYGGLAYCLVSAPKNIVESEKRKLLFNMNVISEESPEYVRASSELEKLITFDDIDYRERVIKIPVHRNDDLIDRMKAKVPIMRTWLSEFHERHMSQYTKT